MTSTPQTSFYLEESWSQASQQVALQSGTRSCGRRCLLGVFENQHPRELLSPHRTKSKSSPIGCPYWSPSARRVPLPHDAPKKHILPLSEIGPQVTSSMPHWLVMSVRCAHDQLSFFLKRIMAPCFEEQLTCW